MTPRMTKFYMDVAQRCAEMSRARRLQVGAVITKNDNILSFSWNGTPAGWDNNCEDREWCSAGGWLSSEEILEGWPYEGTYTDAAGNEVTGRYRLKTRPEVLHAEANALTKLAKGHESGEGATLFCTHAPCMDCAKMIYQTGIKRVIFGQAYRSNDGVQFLKASGVDVAQLDVND